MPSLFPDLEPRARTVAEVFVAEIQRQGFVGVNGEGLPSKKHLEEIRHGARDFVHQVGEEPELLRKIIRAMRKKDLVISSPRSCIKMARDKSQWRAPDAKERYTGGKYADAIQH